MKTIATIATTLLLSLGLLVAPASAEEPTPVVWDTPLCDYAALAGVLNEQIDVLEGNVAQANESVARMVRIANRRHAKIESLRQTIRELRREVRRSH